MEPKDATILVVDDDATLREAIAYDLIRKKFRVLTAENGRIALSILDTTKVDVILSDIRMPAGDGITLLQEIRRTHPEIPVLIFITGFSDISTEDAIKMGARAMFTKPFERSLILAEVYKSIGYEVAKSA